MVGRYTIEGLPGTKLPDGLPRKVWWVLDRITGAKSDMYEHGYCEDIIIWLNDRDSGYSLTDREMRDRIQP